MEQQEPMTEVEAGPYSYLLRLWCEDHAHRYWRISLQDVQTGERIGFASLGSLTDYLQVQMEASTGTKKKPGDPRR